MLCEICHQREATVHTTTVAGDNTKTVNLCGECSGETAPALASLVHAGCHYCGGAFHCTAPDLSSGEQELWALCRRCAEEFYGFWNRKLPGFSSGKVTPEQVIGVPALITELNRHMKEWVLERDSR